MSIKSIIFFIILFGIIILGYFYYDYFLKLFPINILINIFVVGIGLAAIFFPQIMKKVKSGDDMDDIKKYIIEKYIKK